MSEKQELCTVYQKVLNVMADIAYIAKGSEKVNGQYRFVSHDAVVAKLHDAFVKHKLVVIPTVESCVQNGNRTEIKLATVFRNAENPEDAFQVNTYGYGIDGADKGPGKAISYAFKYALLKTFCIETGDDPDNDVKSRHEPERCLDFDSMIPSDFTKVELKKLKLFLADISQSTNRHVEDVKREAIKRMPEFLKALHAWNPKE